MRISVNYDFERRVGLFPAGFDKDGVLYCNQNFADYPHCIPSGKFDAASQQPEWMLLSYQKPVTASSTAENSSPEWAVNEDCRSWWSAAGTEPGEWLCVEQPFRGSSSLLRSHWSLPCNGRSAAGSRCDGSCGRHRSCRPGSPPQAFHLPWVFGNGEGPKPAQAEAAGARVDALDATITWKHIENAQGCNVRYGVAPDKLYLSWLVYDADEVTLSTLTAGQEYYVCVDSFNENGITPGKTFKLEG